MKVNFKSFKVFQNIEKTEAVFIDIHKQLADLLYKFGDGIEGHALCHLIYETEGECELSERQAEYILVFVRQRCTPAIIDSIEEALNE